MQRQGILKEEGVSGHVEKFRGSTTEHISFAGALLELSELFESLMKLRGLWDVKWRQVIDVGNAVFPWQGGGCGRSQQRDALDSAKTKEASYPPRTQGQRCATFLFPPGFPCPPSWNGA